MSIKRNKWSNKDFLSRASMLGQALRAPNGQINTTKMSKKRSGKEAKCSNSRSITVLG
jgi:hypothetical protein